MRSILILRAPILSKARKKFSHFHANGSIKFCNFFSASFFSDLNIINWAIKTVEG